MKATPDGGEDVVLRRKCGEVAMARRAAQNVRMVVHDDPWRHRKTLNDNVKKSLWRLPLVQEFEKVEHAVLALARTHLETKRARERELSMQGGHTFPYNEYSSKKKHVPHTTVMAVP